jgi:hypothetical protein
VAYDPILITLASFGTNPHLTVSIALLASQTRGDARQFSGVIATTWRNRFSASVYGAYE